MSSDRLAVTWFLVILLGLLLGLLILVVALGVARHVRRQRPRRPKSSSRDSRTEEYGDNPVEWRRPPGGNDAED